MSADPLSAPATPSVWPRVGTGVAAAMSTGLQIAGTVAIVAGIALGTMTASSPVVMPSLLVAGCALLALDGLTTLGIAKQRLPEDCRAILFTVAIVLAVVAVVGVAVSLLSFLPLQSALFFLGPATPGLAPGLAATHLSGTMASASLLEAALTFVFQIILILFDALVCYLRPILAFGLLSQAVVHQIDLIWLLLLLFAFLNACWAGAKTAFILATESS